jgi:flagellar motor switch/type III secretory pathway protein FliN
MGRPETPPVIPTPTPDGIDWRLAWDIAQFTLLGGIGIYLHFELRDRARGAQLHELASRQDTRMDDHEQRIARAEVRIQATPSPDGCAQTQQRVARLEVAIQSAPSHKDLEQVYRRIEQMDTRVTSELGRVIGQLDGLTDLTRGMNEHLRTHPR